MKQKDIWQKMKKSKNIKQILRGGSIHLPQWMNKVKETSAME